MRSTVGKPFEIWGMLPVIDTTWLNLAGIGLCCSLPTQEIGWIPADDDVPGCRSLLLQYNVSTVLYTSKKLIPYSVQYSTCSHGLMVRVFTGVPYVITSTVQYSVLYVMFSKYRLYVQYSSTVQYPSHSIFYIYSILYSTVSCWKFNICPLEVRNTTQLFNLLRTTFCYLCSPNPQQIVSLTSFSSLIHAFVANIIL